jgi:hypothetical protein
LSDGFLSEMSAAVSSRIRNGQVWSRVGSEHWSSLKLIPSGLKVSGWSQANICFVFEIAFELKSIFLEQLLCCAKTKLCEKTCNHTKVAQHYTRFQQ